MSEWKLIDQDDFRNILTQRKNALLKQGDVYGSMAGTISGVIKLLDEAPNIYPSFLVIQELREKLSRYEQAEQEGRLVELPCKIGTPAFWQHMDCEQPYKPENCIDHEGSCDKCPHRVPTAIPIEFNYQDIPRFGKTVFLTREEAENALKERENNGL